MEPRPRPLLGAVLGLLLGLVAVAIVWQAGWLDPSRLVLFMVTAVAILAVAALLTRSIAAARGRFVTVAIISGILAGVALTGIPEQLQGGSISDGCALEARVDDTVVTPADTSALDPLEVQDDTVVPWAATSEAEIVVTERVAGLDVGGFEIPFTTVTVEGAQPVTTIEGVVDVAEVLAWVEDRSGLELAGSYHAFGSVSGDGAECVLDGYVRLAPESLWATNVLVGLWITLGALLILIAWGAIDVRMSFTRAERARVEAGRVYSESTTSGGEAQVSATARAPESASPTRESMRRDTGRPAGAAAAPPPAPGAASSAPTAPVDGQQAAGDGSEDATPAADEPDARAETSADDDERIVHASDEPPDDEASEAAAEDDGAGPRP